MIDRTIPPPYHIIDTVDILQAQTSYLDNGIPLHVFNAGEQPLLKIEFIFAAGSYYEPKEGSSYFTVKMLGEGTDKRSSQEISQYVDQYGAFLDFNHGVDRASLSLYTLSKYAPQLFPILKELISCSVFPEKELSNLKNLTLQNLQVNQKKNNFLASKKISGSHLWRSASLRTPLG